MCNNNNHNKKNNQRKNKTDQRMCHVPCARSSDFRRKLFMPNAKKKQKQITNFFFCYHRKKHCVYMESFQQTYIDYITMKWVWVCVGLFFFCYCCCRLFYARFSIRIGHSPNHFSHIFRSSNFIALKPFYCDI